MVLPCRLAEEVAHLQERARIRLEPVLVGVLVGKQQQFVEQAAVRHAFPEPRLVGGEQEQHLVDQQLRVIGIARRAKAKQQVDFVDARKSIERSP